MTYVKLEDVLDIVDRFYHVSYEDVEEQLRSLPTDDGWEELDEWCAKQAKSIMEGYHPLIMQGGFNLNCPSYRKSLGEHSAYMRMRSYIKGARKSALGPLPAPPAC